MSAFDQVAALRHQNQELLERLRVKQKSYRELRRGRERGEQAGGRERGEQAGGRERGEQAGGRGSVLDTDSSLSEKSEQFFTELRDFRQVNREECVTPPLISPSISRPSVFTPSLSPSLSGTHCYRVNSRLFAVPLDPQAACPVCKTPRSQRPAPSAQEPAFIRVSIPRSTLLPAYRYKAHRRKSFDPSDSLALPSDCSVSRVMGGAHTDQLLDLSRSARYHFQRLDQNQELSCSKPHSTAYPVY
ncbi:UNVERIFIED_CONTAM: hypothetical protein FKN15_047711 [Acipenser sinensis]